MTALPASSSTPFAHAVLEVEQRVLLVVARSLDRDPGTVNLNSRLFVDLDAESLDMLDIAYSLERTFCIRMPRVNLLQRASDLFSEQAILKDGIVTQTGMELMRRSMPEIPGCWIKPGMRLYDFRLLITVESLARVVHRCLEAVARLRCSQCGGAAVPNPESAMAMICTDCGQAIELPSGEHLLVDDLRRVGEEMHLPIVGEPA